MAKLTEKHLKKIETIIEKLGILEVELDKLYFELFMDEFSDNPRDIHNSANMENAYNLIHDACERLERIQ